MSDLLKGLRYKKEGSQLAVQFDRLIKDFISKALDEYEDSFHVECILINSVSLTCGTERIRRAAEEARVKREKEKTDGNKETN